MKKWVIASWLLPLAIACGQGERKISLFTAIDLGRVEKGYDLQKDYNSSGVALNRTYVDVGFAQQVDEHFLLNVGVGGIFWKAFEGTGGNPEDKVIKFGPGISNSFMKWMPSKHLDLTFGYFSYKYNMDAKNLGEYLFRSEAYPTIIYTGGWSWMNDVAYHPVGAKLTWAPGEGSFKQDFALFGEYFNSPIYDVTPAYIATWKAADWLTLGGAAALHRFITPTPKTKRDLEKPFTYRENFYLPELPNKRSYTINIPSYVNTDAFAVQYAAGATPDLAALRNQIYSTDSATLASFNVTSAAQIPLLEDTSKASRVDGRPGRYATELQADIHEQFEKEGRDSATYYGDPRNAGSVAKTVSFDLSAIYALAFFSFDFNAMLGRTEESMGEFKLYGEIAQLGFKNYPIFYTKNSQRMPVMLGASVPTFGLLNHLSFEVEYLKNPNIESIASTYDRLELAPDENFRYGIYNRDDYKWSMHASRAISKFLSIHLQVANDHMRLKDGFARPQYIPITNEPGHWYWLTRLQWMI